MARKILKKSKPARAVKTATKPTPSSALPLALYGLATFSFGYAIYCSEKLGDKVSMTFFLVFALGLVVKASFPSWKYELGSQGGLSLIHLIPGIVAGVYGVQALSGLAPNWRVGLPLQIFSFWAILSAFPKKSATALPPLVAPLKSGTQAPSLQTWLNLLTLLVASKLAFYFQQTNFALGLLAAAALLIGVMVFRLGEGKARPPLAREGLWLILILVLAFAMRLPGLWNNIFGLQNDESNMITAMLLVADGTIKSPFTTAWASTATFPYYITAFFYKITGEALFAARLTSIFAGVLAAWIFYRWSRFYFSAVTSLVTVFFFSVSWWTLFHSLSPFHGIFTVLFTICSFYFLEKGLREGNRMDFAWVGVFAAFTMETYVPGRLLPVMISATLLGCLLVGGFTFLKSYWKHLLLSALVFFWLLGPFLVLCYHSPDILLGRAQELSIGSAVQKTGNWILPFKSYWRTFLAFFQNPGLRNDTRFNLPGNPLLDPVMGVFFSGGLVLMLAGLRRRLSWIILPGLVLGMSANALAQMRGDLEYFNAIRCFILFPFALLVVGRFLEWMLSWDLKKWVPKSVLLGGLGLALVGSFAYNVKQFYFSWSQDQGQWEELGYNHIASGELVQQYAPQYHLLVNANEWGNTERVLTGGKIQVTVIKEDTKLPIMNRVTKDVLFLMGTWECKDLQRSIQKIYPGAKWEIWKNRYQFDYFYLIKISKDEFERAQPKKGLLDPLP